MTALLDAHLYGILDTAYVAPSAMGSMAHELIKGGIDLLQLRAKHSTHEEIITMARALLPITQRANIPLLLNDYPHLVPLVGAQGVHLGQNDMSISQARAMLGGGYLIGLSTHSLEQVHESMKEAPDYIGFGPLFSTPTKPDYSAIGVHNIAAAQALVSCPVFCIGGINLTTVPHVLHAGAKRIVMVSALLKDTSPQAMTATIKQSVMRAQER